MRAPTLSEIRSELLWLATRVELLREVEREGSTADVLELVALSLGRNYEMVVNEMKVLESHARIEPCDCGRDCGRRSGFCPHARLA
jgi:hypothetical protein